MDHEISDCESPIPDGVDVNRPPYEDWLRGIPPRIPVWQRQRVSRDGPAENPFMVSSQGVRRQGVVPPLGLPRLTGNGGSLPSLSGPPGFNPGVSNVPSKRTASRVSRQRTKDGTLEANQGLKKRTADDMEITRDGDGKTDGLGHQNLE